MRCVTFTACALALLACGKDEKQPKPPPLPIDGIEVVNPGAEPRRTLRYALAPSTTPLELAMDFDFVQAENLVLMPTLALAVDIETTVADATGGATMKMSVLSGAARPRVDQQKDMPALKVMDRQTALLAGLVVSYKVSSQGAVSDSKIESVNRDLSAPMQEQITTLVQLTEQMAMVLPEKPVGVGAVWKHRRTMHQNKLTLVTNTTLEVTAIDGDRISFKSTTEMTGADQTLAQGSATAQVTKIRGTGSSHGTFDLGKAILLGESNAELTFELVVDGKPNPTKFKSGTKLSPRAETPPADGGGNGSSTGSDPCT